MRVVNPLYSRAFAKQFRSAIAQKSANKVKCHDLLDIHRGLVLINLAFPGNRVDKIERAHNLIYPQLRSKGVRLGGWEAKNVFDLLVELLYGFRADPRKPVWVELNDAHKDDVLNGVGLSDEHWCKTQWVPWMLHEAKDLVDTISLNLDFYKKHANEIDRISSDDVYEFYKNVRNIESEFQHQRELVQSCAAGQELILQHQPVLDQVKASLKCFDQQIEVLGKRFGVDYTRGDLYRMQ